MKKHTLSSMMLVSITILGLVASILPGVLSGPANPGLSKEEIALLGAINVDNAWDELRYLTSLGQKVAGTTEELFEAKYVYKKFVEYDLDRVDMEFFPTTSWDTETWSTFEVTYPVRKSIEAATYGGCYGTWGTEDGVKYSFGNVKGGRAIQAELVDVGYGTAGEFEAAGDVTGKVVLALRNDYITWWPSTVVSEAAYRGALAAVFYGYYGTNVVADGVKQDVVGGPIPSFSISQNSAYYLKNLLANNNRVDVYLESEVHIWSEKYAESVNVIGYIYGSTHPDEYILIGGHIDTWFWGSNDDCSSIAATLELARLFASMKKSGAFVPERTLVFAAVGAEEYGGPITTWYDWLIGSYELVKAHPEMVNSMVIDLNMDGVSFTSATGTYSFELTWEVAGVMEGVVHDLGLTGIVYHYAPVWSWTDAWSYAAKGGGSAVQMMNTPGFDTYYHTQFDDMPMQSRRTLKITLEIYALAAARADRALFLPYDFDQTYNWAMASLQKEMATVSDLATRFGDVKAALELFGKKVTALNSYIEQLETEYNSHRTSANRKAAIEAEATDLNRMMIAVRQNVTRYILGEGGGMGSWDVFFRPDQHVNDLYYVDAALAELKRRDFQTAAQKLENVYTMEWGHLFSEYTYNEIMAWHVDKYWGAEFDQQQEYINVDSTYDLYDAYINTKEGNVETAKSQLTKIYNQLLAWLNEDLKAVTHHVDYANTLVNNHIG